MSQEGLEDFGMLRGHPIKIDPKTRRVYFADTGERTSDTWKQRPCGHCGLHNTTEGHDGCLGTLPKVMNACCGHGEPEKAYVQFRDGFRLGGKPAIDWINTNKEKSNEDR